MKAKKEMFLMLSTVLVSMQSVCGSVNKDYGNCNDDGSDFSYAPSSLVVGNVWKNMSVLTADEYAAAGWLPVVDVAPSVSSNEYVKATGWKKNGNRIERVYVKGIVPIEIPRYSVPDLFFWVKVKGKEAEVDAWLREAGYYSVAVTTQEILADNETFGEIMKAVRESGLFTSDEISDALEYAKVN